MSKIKNLERFNLKKTRETAEAIHPSQPTNPRKEGAAMAKIFDDPCQQARQEFLESSDFDEEGYGCGPSQDDEEGRGEELSLTDGEIFHYLLYSDHPDPDWEEIHRKILAGAVPKGLAGAESKSSGGDDSRPSCSVCGKQDEGGMTVEGKDYCWDHVPYDRLPWPEVPVIATAQRIQGGFEKSPFCFSKY